jgi:hypothetical protein
MRTKIVFTYSSRSLSRVEPSNNLNKRGDVKMKRLSFPISLTIICLLIQACAVHGSPSKNELETMQSIEVVRHKTPDLEAKTSTGVVIKHAMSGPLAGILGHTHNKATFRKMTREKVLPDYGELLTRKFTDRVRGEVPGWPETTLREIPVHGHFDSRVMTSWISRSRRSGFHPSAALS